jgi:hypothetical protein
VILSADGDFLSHPHQVMAIWDKELVLIHLPSKWQNARRHEQAAHLLLWWGRIEKMLDTAVPRQCWKVPYEFSREGKLFWPAPGSEDTELGVLMEPEVGHGETEVYPRVQA